MFYVLPRSGKPSRKNELVSAEAFDLDYLREGVIPAELFLHVPPRLVSNVKQALPWRAALARARRDGAELMDYNARVMLEGVAAVTPATGIDASVAMLTEGALSRRP